MAPSLLDALLRIDFTSLCLSLVFILLLGHFLSYFADYHCIRSNGIPGPLIAGLSDAWLGWVAAHGHRSEVVHELHEKYGTFVRIAPNHVSVCDPDALQIIYAHGVGTLKSDFYDAFVSIRRGLFNTRSRLEHTRKRKIVAHVFSQKNVLEFEPHIQLHVRSLIEQWDKLCVTGERSLSGDNGEGGLQGHGDCVRFDCLPWYNYLAFDIIGDLAFGSPFGMLKAAKDAAPVAKDQKSAIAGYGSAHSSGAESACTFVEIPAVQILNDRGEYSAAMGCLPPLWRPLARRLPWFSNGSKAVENLAGLAIAAVSKRLMFPTDRADLLSKLQSGKDDDGNPMGREELTAEALTQLIAGSDTTSNSSCAVTYYVACNISVQERLHQELDEALSTNDDPVSSFEQVKRLPYLEAVINETLRIHSTSALGLPRTVPEGGLTVLGKSFPEGTVLSVPSYTIHRNKAVWGEDADVFRPERWLERDPRDLQKAFNPFSIGPRACIGRNLASMELLIIISSIFRRYDFVLEKPDTPIQTREGFLRKPLACRVSMKRRV